jgi:hypothetical protein
MVEGKGKRLQFGRFQKMAGLGGQLGSVPDRQRPSLGVRLAPLGASGFGTSGDAERMGGCFSQPLSCQPRMLECIARV